MVAYFGTITTSEISEKGTCLTIIAVLDLFLFRLFDFIFKRPTVSFNTFLFLKKLHNSRVALTQKASQITEISDLSLFQYNLYAYESLPWLPIFILKLEFNFPLFLGHRQRTWSSCCRGKAAGISAVWRRQTLPKIILKQTLPLSFKDCEKTKKYAVQSNPSGWFRIWLWSRGKNVKSGTSIDRFMHIMLN